MNTHSFDEIFRRIQEIELPEPFDMVVAITNGGIIPGGLLNERLQLPFNLLHINWRDENNNPRGAYPVLLRPQGFDCNGKRIILTDDLVHTGTTFAFAKDLLSAARQIKTFAINGAADYSLFHESHFQLPWQLDSGKHKAHG